MFECLPEVFLLIQGFVGRELIVAKTKKYTVKSLYILHIYKRQGWTKAFYWLKEMWVRCRSYCFLGLFYFFSSSVSLHLNNGPSVRLFMYILLCSSTLNLPCCSLTSDTPGKWTCISDHPFDSLGYLLAWKLSPSLLVLNILVSKPFWSLLFICQSSDFVPFYSPS